MICFLQAIEQIKDLPLLYNNRALTYINLNVYDKAKEDLNWALRLNVDCLKSWLLLAKVNLLEENRHEFENCLREATERNPNEEQFIKSKLLFFLYRIGQFYYIFDDSFYIEIHISEVSNFTS